MFSKICSVYAGAYDNIGRFWDETTQSHITSMSIGDFCLSDRWKPIVLALRGMIEKYGVKEAKSMDEYRRLKMNLPAATLSGLFKPTLVEKEKKDPHSGKVFTVKEMVSRRKDLLDHHTGFICIDIDLQDNQSLSDLQIIIRILQHRPEVALLMKSCSGTGYFALVPIANPLFHKEHFRALQCEYSALGIVIDKQCSDVTRVRYASYDENPYVNRNAVSYSRMDMEEHHSLQRINADRNETILRSSDNTVDRVEELVTALEKYRIDVTNDYKDWIRVGYSLATLPEPYGRSFFHRVSSICSKYNAVLCEKQFNHLLNPKNIGIGTFFRICADYGVLLKQSKL